MIISSLKINDNMYYVCFFIFQYLVEQNIVNELKISEINNSNYNMLTFGRFRTD